MRFVVYGVGAVGGVIGGHLWRAGLEVVGIARGSHYEAIRDRGLRITSPRGSFEVPLEIATSPAEVAFRKSDVVILAMKSQDTLAAVGALADVAPPELPVFCAQNGVVNERIALRRFVNVYGVHVALPATFLVPGVVAAHSTPTPGILDLGRSPHGVDVVGRRVAEEFERAGFVSLPRPDIQRWKYGKLIINLGNAVDALCGLEAREGRLISLARDEARKVLDTAGIDFVSHEEDRIRRGDILQKQDAAEQPRRGSSSWQSLARGSASIETDYLNGEIVLLGRLHGVPTPVNELLQRAVRHAMRQGLNSGSVSEADLLEHLASAGVTAD